MTGWVAFLVIGAVVPLLLLATVTFREISKTSFAFTEEEQADTTRVLALAVDGEVRSWRSALLALAASQSLRHDRLAEFYEEARQVEGGSDRRFDGTGLGLSIVKEFVDLHGGSIVVGEPTTGRGTVFRVELPLGAPSGSAVSRTAEEPDVEPAPQVVEGLGLRHPAWLHPDKAPPGSPVVLGVEDNPDMNAFMAMTLSRTYHVVSALDGQEGLQKALELRPDLILCDVMMPRTSGDQLVREIRRCRELDDVPIVLLTAKIDERLRMTLLKEGAQDYLHKPVNVGHLLARVERLISDRRRADR